MLPGSERVDAGSMRIVVAASRSTPGMVVGRRSRSFHGVVSPLILFVQDAMRFLIASRSVSGSAGMKRSSSRSPGESASPRSSSLSAT